MKTKLSWVLSGLVAFIFAQSLIFKFSGSTETAIIFNTLSDWVQSIGLGNTIADIVGAYGAYLIGAAELVAVVLILIPRTRFAGALTSLSIISGAIAAHLFTPLGIDRVVDAAGNTDGGTLFFTAIGVAVASAVLCLLNRPAESVTQPTLTHLNHA